MDEIVQRALERWPNVPAVYGWLKLDRRGTWWLRVNAADPPLFERITNAGLREFIGRNYERDANGAWFFQNGPQRVYVALEYTPFVYRLDDQVAGFVAHTDVPVQRLHAAYLDETGALILATDLGPGVLVDRDLEALIDRSTLADRTPLSAFLDAEPLPASPVKLLGHAVELAPIQAAAVPQQFGFVQAPARS